MKTDTSRSASTTEGSVAVKPKTKTKTQRRSKKGDKDDSVRFNLYLPKEVYEGLEETRQLTGKSSIAETVRSAVKLYQLIQESLHEGKELYLQDREEDIKERLIPS